MEQNSGLIRVNNENSQWCHALSKFQLRHVAYLCWLILALTWPNSHDYYNCNSQSCKCPFSPWIHALHDIVIESSPSLKLWHIQTSWVHWNEGNQTREGIKTYQTFLREKMTRNIRGKYIPGEKHNKAKASSDLLCSGSGPFMYFPVYGLSVMYFPLIIPII